MAHRDLRDFISQIDAFGELHRVTVAVDSCLEIAELTSRVCKMASGGPALLFDLVNGTPFRIASNLFGSEKRVAAALGRQSLDGLAAWLQGLLDDVPGATAVERLNSLTSGRAGACVEPVRVAAAPCQEVRSRVPDLLELPVPKSWPGDGVPDHDGRFITLPLVVTGAVNGGLNCGIYRVALLGKDRAAIHWGPKSGGARHFSEWSSAGKAMPVAIAVGGAPALIFAAMLPLPDGLDEFLFAGMLRGEPVETVKCLTCNLMVPAGAELVIEGVIEPEETAPDGAFGNHTGYYHPSSPAPLLRVTAITRRHDMIYPTTVVGPPPMEDCWLAAAAGRLYLSLIRIDIPEVTALHQPFAGIFHGATIMAVRNGAGRGSDLLAAIRKTPWFSGSRLIVIVDEEQDPADVSGVYWRVMNNVAWGRDMVIDGGFLGLDATAKPDGRHLVRMDEEMARYVESRWREYGFSDGR